MGLVMIIPNTGGGGSVNQDNINVEFYFRTTTKPNEGLVANLINALPQFEITEIQEPFFKVITHTLSSSLTIRPITTVYKFRNIGKGTYGQGGTQINKAHIIQIAEINSTSSDIEDIDDTQLIDLGEIDATAIHTAFNNHTFTGEENPIQEQAEGYVLVNTLVSGELVQYLFIGSGGEYGTSGSETATADDFVLFTDLYDSNNKGILEINQTAHGLAVNEAIRFNGTNYIKALADSPANSDVVGVVIDVIDADNFKFQYSGIVTTGSWTLGSHYFLSNATTGAIILEPTYQVNEVRQYIGQGIPQGLLLNINIGDQIEDTEDKLVEDNAVTGTKNIDWTKDTFLFTLTGDTTFSDINLPTSGTNTKVITIHMTGEFTPTWPSGYTDHITGSYDGTKLNTITVEFIKAGYYKVQITQED